MRRLTALKVSAAFAALTLAGPASASTCIGNCGTVAPNGSISAPPGGGTIQFVSTAGGTTGAGQIGSVGGTNGSEFITDNFSAVAGDPLAFNFNYITTDGSGFSDYAFAELQTSLGATVAYLFTARTVPPPGNTSPGFGLPANGATLTPGSTPIISGQTIFSPLGTDSGRCFDSGCGNTGWIASLFNIGQSGDFRLRFGVTNFSDTQFQSALAFSGVTVNNAPVIGAVPEPTTWAMMLIGFGAIGASMRRRRRVTATLELA